MFLVGLLLLATAFAPPLTSAPTTPPHAASARLLSVSGVPPTRPAVAPAGAPAGGVIAGASLLDEIPVGSQPTHATYDARDDYLYATNFGLPALYGNNVSIINASTSTVLAEVPVGDDPLNGVYAPNTGYMYILNYGVSCNVTVFNGTSIIEWIPTGCTPSSGVFDSANDLVYISNTGSNNVSVLSAGHGNHGVVATFATGLLPLQAVFDPSNDYIYVPNAGSNNVTILDGASANTTLVGSVNVGNTPQAAIYDPGDGYVYVSNFGSDSLTLLSGSSLVRTIPGGGGPTGLGYDPITQYVYADDQGSDTVYIVNGTTEVANVSVGNYPRDATFDAANGYEYVPLWLTGQVDVFNGTQLIASVYVGNAPYSSVYDPATQSVYTCLFNGNNVSRVGSPSPGYPVTFNESGLPAGENWTVQVGASNYTSDASSLGFLLGNGSYDYSVPPVPGFRAVVAAGSVRVQGAAPAVINVTFEAVYPVWFNETGLSGGPAWGATIDNVTNQTDGSSLQILEPNGSYAYHMTEPPGYATHLNGSVQVSGGPETVVVTFHEVTFNVTFVESGLSGGRVVWSVDLSYASNRSTTGSVGFEVPNGSYSWKVPTVPGYLESPSSGYLSVNGSGRRVDVTFVPLYAILFNETGLPGGSVWSVAIGRTVNSSNATSLGLEEKNGSYEYTVATTATGFYAPHPTGQAKVEGGTLEVSVPFEPIPANNTTYELWFSESGLAVGTSWSVTLGGREITSTEGAIGFWVGNGSFAYTVRADGYTASPASGEAQVYGAASVRTPIGILFRPIGPATYPVRFQETGLPQNVAWNVTLGPVTNGSRSGEIEFEEPNGTYFYLVGPSPGYATDHVGYFVVDGAATTVPLAFLPFTYPVTFRETGLAPGTVWGVTLNGVTRNASGSTLTVEEPNGTASYTVPLVAGYATPPGGILAVDGAAVAGPTLAFVAAPAPGGSGPGLAELAGAAVLGVAVAVVVALLVLRSRGRGGATTPAEADTAYESYELGPETAEGGADPP